MHAKARITPRSRADIVRLVLKVGQTAQMGRTIPPRRIRWAEGAFLAPDWQSQTRARRPV
jgi:hypothetical protein